MCANKEILYLSHSISLIYTGLLLTCQMKLQNELMFY